MLLQKYYSIKDILLTEKIKISLNDLTKIVFINIR